MILSVTLRPNIILLSCALAIAVGCDRTPRQPDRPNIVLIVIDTLRADRLSFYGHDEETAPFLASLAERSLVFRAAHSNSSWTAPAMASLFTSLYPFQHGVHTATLGSDRESFEVRVLPADAPTLPESLGSLGYKTFGVSDNQNVSEIPGFDRGFDVFESTSYESAEKVEETVLAWRSQIVSSEPYFLYIHFMDPHMPYHGREPWYDEPSGIGEIEDEEADALARYDSEIRFVDQHVARLFAAFGWGDDTVVLVTSDHGEEFGEHGGAQHGRTLYREVLDIPFLVSWPARWSAGRVVDARVSLVDVAPTLLSLAGHAGEKTHVGRSVVADLDSAGGAAPIYGELVREEDPSSGAPIRQETRSVIEGRFKYIDRPGPDEQLFDLAVDAHETQNVLDIHPEVGARLAADLERAIEHSPRYRPGLARVPLSPEQVEKLKALGYAE